jgi:hypothetical protein
MRKGAWFGLMLVGSLLANGCGCSDDENDATAGTGGDAGSAGSSGSGGKAGADAASDAGAAGMSGADGGGLDIWSAWEQIRTAMRTSPDHLPARADEAVASKDPVKIFELVRDKIATYPPESEGFTNIVPNMRWGTRGTLRGGAGTPREKAELLVELYARAGFDAEVVHGAPDPAKLDGKKVLWRVIDRPFAPVYTPAEAEAWNLALGHPTPAPRTAIDATGSRAAALATSLLGQLPNTLSSTFDFTMNDMPLVRVQVNGEWKYANPIAPGAAFGDPVTSADPTPTGNPYPTQEVRVTLEAARADDPYTRFTLVEGSFDAADVVGRRIQVGFAPPVAIETLAGMRVQDVETLVPVLNVIGPDMTKADKDRLATVGDMFSLGGDRYEDDGSGGLIVNGEPVAAGVTDPAVIARVTTVKARVQGNSYPRIGVTVSALDPTGKQVPRLGASAFTVKEDGKPVSFSLTRNEAPPPRVVLLFDLSTSVPPEFLGAGAVAVGNQIVSQLYAAYPEARVRVATIYFGARFVTTTWATSLAEAQAQVADLATAPGSSEIWDALYDVEKQDPTVVIMTTDGVTTDEIRPETRAALATGAPVLSIGVGTVDQATLDQISQLSGGKSVPATQQQQAIDAAIAEIDARAIEDYRLSYQAPKGTATTRNVSVTINVKDGTGSYTVPVEPAMPKALSGLYLTISAPGRSETVPIAGFAKGFSTAFPVITQAMLDDVRAQLLGRVSIAVEGAAPSPSVIMDDWIGEKLTLRPLYEAATAKDDAAVLEALENGFNLSPSKLPIAQPPLPNAQTASSLTFETSPRMAIMLQKLQPSGPVTRQLSLYPLSQWVTAAEDPRDAWERTVKATAALAVMESEMFSSDSTEEELAGQTLTAMDPGSADTQAGLTPDEQLEWAEATKPFNNEYTLLVPIKPGAFWAVHEPTGTVIGMMPDGTGTGGVEGVCSTYDMANRYLQMLDLLGSLFGVSLGGWDLIAAWEVKNLTMATLVIGYGAAAGEISNPGVDLACNAAGDALGDAIPGWNEWGRLQELAEEFGGDAGQPSLCGDDGPGPCG